MMPRSRPIAKGGALPAGLPRVWVVGCGGSGEHEACRLRRGGRPDGPKLLQFVLRREPVPVLRLGETRLGGEPIFAYRSPHQGSRIAATGTYSFGLSHLGPCVGRTENDPAVVESRHRGRFLSAHQWPRPGTRLSSALLGLAVSPCPRMDTAYPGECPADTLEICKYGSSTGFSY